MLDNNAAFKYDTPYKGSFVITQCWINDTVTWNCGTIQIRYNISCIKSCKSDTNVEDNSSENDVWQFQHLNFQLYTSVYIY